MPITFLLDVDLGLVRTTFTGMIGLADLAHYVYLLSQRDWLRLPQLVDGRQGGLTMSPQDVRILSDLMVRLRDRWGCAPVAFVPGNDVNACVAAQYQDHGAGGNPWFATFADLHSAEQWIASLTPVAQGSAERSAVAARLQVLVVDDTHTVRSVIGRTLQAAGFEVRSTASAMEAIELVWEAQGTLDLAVIDLQLDGISGDALAAAIGRLQPGLPMLFISGEDAPERTQEGPLLLKPFRPDALARCVRQYLETGCCDHRPPVVGWERAAREG
jgi:CheY-like chemotaxis protein